MTVPRGYIDDVPYVAELTAELSPDWLDLVAVIGGVEPPRRDGGFAWCELGCGRGVSAVACAAAHPDATCLGVDLMPAHIASAERASKAADTRNLSLHALGFDAALALDLPPLHYIVAHGVYSWIDGDATRALHRFVDRHLAPGGLVYLSYNAMPGWAADAPFQHLVRAIGATLPGDSHARFARAASVVQDLTRAGAPALLASGIAADWAQHQTRRDPAYFAHEYLAPAWRALYVDDVRREMAGIGLTPVGSATLAENFDTLVLQRAAREVLRAIPDGNQRELARDYFLSQRFRRDVFGRGVRRIADRERRARLFETRYTLLHPADRVRYSFSTDAGTVGFDNRVARRIVAALSAGPRPLGDCVESGGDESDVLANALTLCCAGVLWPGASTPWRAARGAPAS